jgi:hypothetical protein
MITQVASYKTSDNQLHACKSDALKHEFRLEIRGAIQAAGNNPSGNYTATQMAQIVTNNAALMAKTIAKYNKLINNALAKEKPVTVGA